MTDETNTRGYKFSKEELKKCIIEEDAAIAEYNKKEIDISEPLISSYIPEDISDLEREMLTGIVI